MHNYKQLEIWNRAVKLTTNVYRVINFFPEEEKFGLTSQIKRSAVSVPSNIAEGCGRNTDKDFAKFLSISLGSLYELDTQLLLSIQLEFIEFDQYQPLSEEINEIQKMTRRLIDKFSKSNV